MYKIVISKHSPLRCMPTESQSSYWDRLARIARGMMKKNMTSRYAMQRLAFIAQELPIDFDSCDNTPNEKNFFLALKEFMAKQDNDSIKIFRQTMLAYIPDHESPIASIIIPKK